MESNCDVGEGLSREDKLHVVCAVMGVNAETLLQRVVDRYYNMLVRHAGTFEDAVPNTASEKNHLHPPADDPSTAPEASTSASTADVELPPARLTIDPAPEVSTPSSDPIAPPSPQDPAFDASPSALANGTLPAAKKKRTRRWASLPTEGLDQMIIEALQKSGACSLRELTVGTGYSATSRLLERAYELEKQGRLEVIKEGRSYLIDLTNR